MKVNIKRFKILLAYTFLMTGMCLILLVMVFNRPVERVYMTENKIVVGKPNVDTREFIDVCSTSSVKTYMDYRKITSKTSNQYKYIQEFMSVNSKGLLVDKDGYIGVALGSYFGKIGSRYIITLDTGVILKVIKAEEKSDRHTISGCYQKYDYSVIEILVDKDIAYKYFGNSSNGLVLNGNFNNHNDFKGNIESIEVVR